MEKEAVGSYMNSEAVGSYMKCDVILGGAAEIGGVWSTAELSLRKARYDSNANETLLFLKFNHRLWDLN